MALTSISFLYLFLPISVGIYYAVPDRYKNAALLIISLVFYSMAQPLWLVLLILSVSVDYLLAQWVADFALKGRKNRFAVGVSVAKSLLMIGAYGVLYQIHGVLPPLGVQVYTLTALGYIIDVYRGDTPHDATPVEFGLYCCFFGKIFTGPITDYGDFKVYLKEKTPSLSLMSAGLVVFVWGFAKQIILARGMTIVYSQLRAIPLTEQSFISGWAMVMAYAFTLYYTLSGFCDMARGLAQIFSFKLPRNYYYPFQARSVQTFFDHFNITFTRFVRRYVYLSLGGDDAGRASAIANTLLTTILMGLWFGIRLNLVLWGIYFTVFILLERYVYGGLLKRLPPLFCRVYTFGVVLMSFTVFSAGSLHQFIDLIKSMLGMGGGSFYTSQVMYIVSQNWLIFAGCLLFATSISEKISGFFYKYLPVPTKVAAILVNAVLLISATGFILL